MRPLTFKAGGALTDDQAYLYIQRTADDLALNCMKLMEYLLLIEPRQQGKTSLINHILRHPSTQNKNLVYVDVTTLASSCDAGWYESLALRIARQLNNGYFETSQFASPNTSAEWRDFLSTVARTALARQRQIVIALDEIGAVNLSGTTEFFSVLRDVYSSRQAEQEFKWLSFILAGAFHPRDLISDDRISPFNIAQRIRLEDFSLQQVSDLVGKGGWMPTQAGHIAKRIHYWTDGQPYLTQLICKYLGPEATSADVDLSVDRIRREDENHLPPLLRRLDDDLQLKAYVEKIRAGAHIRFYPRENRRQAQLELLGIVKQDAEGFCTVRNRIYEQVLNDSVSTLPYSPNPVHLQVQRLPESTGEVPATTRSVKFVLKLTQKDEQSCSVEVLDSAKGQALAIAPTPFSPDSLVVVLKALQALTQTSVVFDDAQKELLRELELWSEDGALVPSDKLLELVGQYLYERAIPEGPVRVAFEVSRAEAETLSVWSPVQMQMRFYASETDLARCPWELIHDGNHCLLRSQEVNLTRYINHGAKPRSVLVQGPLRLLYVAPRPMDLDELPSDAEEIAIRQELQGLTQGGKIVVDELPHQTYDELVKYLEVHRNDIHLMHFDGHGAFCRLCPKRACQTQNHVKRLYCSACGASLRHSNPTGMLALERDKGDQRVDWLTSKELNRLVHPTTLRVVVLSACSTATMLGQTLFGGLAPALIQAGIPAVVATQLPITVSNATQFAEGFYNALARFESIPDAVSIGRGRIRDHEWFIPVLYLRDRDDTGGLFIQS